MQDPDRDLARLRTSGMQISLNTADLCCLLVLRARESETAAIDEDEVMDLLERVHDQFPGAENPRKRATHGLQKLREQRVLTRVDVGGVSRRGEYALSGVGRAVIDFFLEDAKLTRESLKVLTATLTAQLTRVREHARTAATPEAWRDEVLLPLTVVSRDLLAGIERRTRGLDEEQEEVRKRIAQMLSDHWLVAMKDSEALLEETTARLGELRDVILEEQKGLETVLDDVEGLARAGQTEDVERAARELGADLARLADWAVRRHDAWSDYYQVMLATLRSLVRLDPDRALTQRLRDHLRAWPDQPWSLALAPTLRMTVLRDVTALIDRPPVERDHRPEVDPENVTAPPTTPLEERVEAAFEAGARTLADVLRRVLPELPIQARYRDAGRIAAIVAKRAHIDTPLEREWVHVADGLFTEEWRVEPRP